MDFCCCLKLHKMVKKWKGVPNRRQRQLTYPTASLRGLSAYRSAARPFPFAACGTPAPRRASFHWPDSRTPTFYISHICCGNDRKYPLISRPQSAFQGRNLHFEYLHVQIGKCYLQRQQMIAVRISFGLELHDLRFRVLCGLFVF